MANAMIHSALFRRATLPAAVIAVGLLIAACGGDQAATTASETPAALTAAPTVQPAENVAPSAATPAEPIAAVSTSVFVEPPLDASAPETASVPVTASAAPSVALAVPAVAQTQPPATIPPPPATATAAPTLTPLPPANLEPQGAFADWWSGDTALEEALGLARIEAPVDLPIAWQAFERGLMVWRSDERRIYALLADGTWESYADTFVEGEMERDAALSAPGNLLQPVRGFGKIWRDDRTLQQRIGWATNAEGPTTAAIQYFDNGFALRVGARLLAVYDTGDGNQWAERR